MSILALLAANAGSGTPVDPDPDPPPPGWSLGEPGDPIHVPAGSLDTWRAARENADNELVEVLYFGDSTGYGQQPAGLTPAPPPYMLRAESMADGYPDGGVGLYGTNTDHVAPLGVDHAGVLAPMPSRTVQDSWDMLLSNVWQTTTTGASVTFQGKGTHCRLWGTNVGSISAHYTYEVDGGAPVEVSHVTADGRRVPTLLTFPEGTHEVKVTNLGGDLRVIPDWFRATGLVWHRASVPGQSSGWVGRDSGRTLNDHLGLDAAGTTERTDRPRHRRVRLAIYGLGINDQQQSIPILTMQGYATTFITKARAAGADPVVLIPHLEAANRNVDAPAYRAALYEVAADNGAAVCDIGSGGALGPAAGWISAGYVSSMTDPHLYQLGYQTQMTYLWDNLLKL